jgi:mono/diheme cytochrome c family protein
MTARLPHSIAKTAAPDGDARRVSSRSQTTEGRAALRDSSLRIFYQLIAGVGVAFALVVTVASQTGTAPATSTQSVRGGVYTKEQAARGEKLYIGMCSECHGDDLAGREQALPLAGPEFGAVWEGQPISALLVRVRQMPPNKPNSLSRPQMVDILSYILSFNGLPAGMTPLSDEQSAWTRIIYQMPPLTN